MNHTDLQRFRAQLNDIRTNMGGIKEQAAQLNALLDEERLIPGEIAEKLIHALQEYQEKSALLQKTGKEISMTLTDSLVQIEDELKTAEENAEKDLWRTYHKHLGEDGKKKGMSFALGFLQQMSRSHRVVARDGSARMSKVKKPGE